MIAHVEAGDLREVIAGFDPDTFDACVTDPPYELGFMGKSWDRTGIAFDPDAWSAVWYALKPGAHVVAFGGTRTWHRIACAIEDAGFEVRDNLAWLYGQGFPKSLDVSKAIDKAAGAERKVQGFRRSLFTGTGRTASTAMSRNQRVQRDEDGYELHPITAPATAEAEQWQGWGTALKPSFEPIILARKPLIGTVAANVLAHGTGALNIDGCRVGDSGGFSKAGVPVTSNEASVTAFGDGLNGIKRGVPLDAGRWPPNACADEDVAADIGANARYFYCPKAGAKERDAGLEHWPALTGGDMCEDRAEGSAGLKNPRAGAGRGGNRRNPHPTVKPVELMRWLCRLVTPTGGMILDPFCGSGSTGIGAVLEGFDFAGIDKDEGHVKLARDRIAHWGRGRLNV